MSFQGHFRPSIDQVRTALKDEKKLLVMVAISKKYMAQIGGESRSTWDYFRESLSWFTLKDELTFEEQQQYERAWKQLDKAVNRHEQLLKGKDDN